MIRKQDIALRFSPSPREWNYHTNRQMAYVDRIFKRSVTQC